MMDAYRVDRKILLRMIEREGFEPAEFYCELFEATAKSIMRAYDMGRDGRDLTEAYPYITKVIE